MRHLHGNAPFVLRTALGALQVTAPRVSTLHGELPRVHLKAAPGECWMSQDFCDPRSLMKMSCVNVNKLIFPRLLVSWGYGLALQSS
eukprot:jgi/Botrbrau1/5381/Bobra.0346s0042.1